MAEATVADCWRRVRGPRPTYVSPCCGAENTVRRVLYGTLWLRCTACTYLKDRPATRPQLRVIQGRQEGRAGMTAIEQKLLDGLRQLPQNDQLDILQDVARRLERAATNHKRTPKLLRGRTGKMIPFPGRH